MQLSKVRALAERGDEHMGRLRNPSESEQTAHRRLMGHRMSYLDIDARQTEPFGDERRRHDSTIAADRQDAIDALPTGDSRDQVDIAEIDRLRDVTRSESNSARVAITGNDLVADLLRVPNRGELRDARPEEQQSGHTLLASTRLAAVYGPAAAHPVNRRLMGYRRRSMEHLWNGKEGVDGSRPSEGFGKFLLISSLRCRAG